MNEEYIIDNQGKKRKATKVICDFCGKSFLKPTRFLLKHKRNYCSQECAFNARKNRIKVTCALCGREFEVTPKILKKSKSGLVFCSRKCKDEGQKIKNGLTPIHPSHYGNTKYKDYTPSCVYQRICFENHPHKCCVCGEENIVAVHHYDGNHNNNEPSNLIPLCPTHHCYWHSNFRELIKDKVDEYINNFINKNTSGV